MNKLGTKSRPRKIPPDPQYEQISPIPSHFNICPAFFQYKFLKCKSEPHVKIEGKDTDDWLCVDFGKLF